MDYFGLILKKAMTLRQHILISLLLIFPQLVFSQEIALNKSPDTLGVRRFEYKTLENRAVQPQWNRGAVTPAVLIIAGTITLLPESSSFYNKYSIHDDVLKMFPNAKSHIDNYLQFAPLAAVFGLKAIGVKSRSDLINQIIISAKAELLMNALVDGMKYCLPTRRPSGGQNSMPSGHTAQAFVSATILDMEYRDTSRWISVAGYAAAATTGMYRMINDRHWISDVLIGAGIGIFSTKVVYYTHRYRWGKKGNKVILPAVYRKGGGAMFAIII